MTDVDVPPPEEIIRYEKDPTTRIATITLNRPDQLNVPTIAARRRYADLLFKASIDDDVKVLVVRGVGDHLGTGADLEELMAKQAEGVALQEEFGLDDEDDVTMPGSRSYRAGASLLHWYGNARSGCRSLQDFKKISILEVKGYCYGWHFYQAADADLVISSDDTLFGHPAFRYVGYAPRMWQWAMMMGLRKFQEMVFTGRPFTAEQMYDCNFVNSVVPRGRLEAEVEKYALGVLARPAHRHRVHAKGVLRGDEATPGRVHGQSAQCVAGIHGRDAARRRRRRAGDAEPGDHGARAEPRGEGQRRPISPRVAAEQIRPPASRIRRAVTRPQANTRRSMSMTPPLGGLRVVDLSTWIGGAYCTKLLADGGAEVIKVEPPEGDPLRRWSASGAAIPSDTDGALFNFLSASKQSVVVDGDRPGDLARLQSLLATADAVVWSRGSPWRSTPCCARRDPSGASAPDRRRRSPRSGSRAMARHAATEFTLQAWSGAISGLARGRPDRAPVFVGGQIGEWLAGAVRRHRRSWWRNGAPMRAGSSSTCRCSKPWRCASPIIR